MEFRTAAEHRAWLETQAPLPAGFRAGTCTFSFIPVEVGKPARMTMTLIAADKPTDSFAAVFTRNAFPGAPVIIGRNRLHEPSLGAVIVNNKISNVCARNGVAASEVLCAAVADVLGMEQKQVLPSSTGVIGWKLPLDAMIAAIPEAASSLQSSTFLPAAEGIMTTDLYPKIRRVACENGSIVGIAKGAGMIEPNMATMLVYILTDLDIPRNVLRNMLAKAVPTTFNAITIDSDQSTSDTVCVMSSKVLPCDDLNAFAGGLQNVCAKLAEDVVRNGEGVKHVMKVTVTGAPTQELARGTAKSVANSPLFQCALCGNDPNVGRLVCAVGKYLGNAYPDINVDSCTISIGGHGVFADGAFNLDPTLEDALTEYMKNAEMYETAPPDENGVFRPPVSWPTHERSVEIEIDLGQGQAQFTAIGADRTHEYISENADYRS